jgi:hypothetical protein
MSINNTYFLTDKPVEAEAIMSVIRFRSNLDRGTCYRDYSYP